MISFWPYQNELEKQVITYSEYLKFTDELSVEKKDSLIIICCDQPWMTFQMIWIIGSWVHLKNSQSYDSTCNKPLCKFKHINSLWPSGNIWLHRSSVQVMSDSTKSWWRHQMEIFFELLATGPRWIPRTKASDAELWCFLWSASE